MSNKLFYSYIHPEVPVGDIYNSYIPVSYMAAYYDSLVFDVNHRTIWHEGMPYGNVYPGTVAYGEVFNDIDNNIARGRYSTAEGGISYAFGSYSHAEGYATYATGDFSHAEGYVTIAYASYSHTEGYKTYVHGIIHDYNEDASENIKNVIDGFGSHAEGGQTIVY